MAEGWLKPLSVPLDEMTVDDETTTCLMLESCRRMLMMAHFWYSRWWHHLEIRLRRGGQLPNKGSKSLDCCQEDFSALKCSLLWHVITLPQRLLGNVTRTPWMFLAFLSMQMNWNWKRPEWISEDSHQPHGRAASLLLLSHFHLRVKLVSQQSAQQVDSCVFPPDIKLWAQTGPASCMCFAPSLAVAKSHQNLKKNRDVPSEALLFSHISVTAVHFFPWGGCKVNI